jgi:hypothetical protein
MTRTLQDDLYDLANAIAAEMYGCDLDRLDPEELEWYGSQLTEDNLEELANDLAAAAWQSY